MPLIAYLTPTSKHGSIVEIEGEPDTGRFTGFKTKDGRLIGRDRWYRTREAAVRHMNALRENRIRSLKQEIERLEALTYDLD